MKQTGLFLLLLIFAFPALSAGIYRCKDENGQVRFSDSLCPSAEPVEIQVNSGVQFPSREWPDTVKKHYQPAQQNKRIGYSDKKKLRYYERERAKLLERSMSANLPVGKRQDIQKELNRLNGKIAGIKPPVENYNKPKKTQPAQSNGAINVHTGEYYPNAGTGIINPRTGEYYPRASKNGYVNPKNGEYIPAIQ